MPSREVPEQILERAVDAAVEATMPPEEFKRLPVAAHDNHRATLRAGIRAALPALTAEHDKELEAAEREVVLERDRREDAVERAEKAEAALGKEKQAREESVRLILAEAEKRQEAALAQQLQRSVINLRERLERLERFGLREDAEHPGFTEIGPVPGGAFLRREQVIAALSSPATPTEEPCDGSGYKYTHETETEIIREGSCGGCSNCAPERAGAGVGAGASSKGGSLHLADSLAKDASADSATTERDAVTDCKPSDPATPTVEEEDGLRKAAAKFRQLEEQANEVASRIESKRRDDSHALAAELERGRAVAYGFAADFVADLLPPTTEPEGEEQVADPVELVEWPDTNAGHGKRLERYVLAIEYSVWEEAGMDRTALLERLFEALPIVVPDDNGDEGAELQQAEAAVPLTQPPSPTNNGGEDG